MKTTQKNEWMFWILLAAPFIYLFIKWNSIPQTVPIHWNIKGEVDDWSSKNALFILSGINVFIYVLLLILPKIDPRSKNYSYFEGSYKKIKTTLIIFFTVFSFAIIFSSEGKIDFSGKWFFLISFMLFAILGNYMRTIRSNFFIGIRTPWTLDNPEVWKRTHETGGKLMFYAGIAGALLVFIMPLNWGTYLFLAFVILPLLFSVIYSYWLFRKMEKEKQHITM